MEEYTNECGWEPVRPMTGQELHISTERFLDALDEVKEMHLRKGRDYGTSDDPFANVRNSESWGVPAWAGGMLRADDKMVRLKSFLTNGALANEGVEDSLLDIATYALISLVLFREEQMARAALADELCEVCA